MFVRNDSQSFELLDQILAEKSPNFGQEDHENETKNHYHDASLNDIEDMEWTSLDLEDTYDCEYPNIVADGRGPVNEGEVVNQIEAQDLEGNVKHSHCDRDEIDYSSSEKEPAVADHDDENEVPEHENGTQSSDTPEQNASNQNDSRHSNSKQHSDDYRDHSYDTYRDGSNYISRDRDDSYSSRRDRDGSYRSRRHRDGSNSSRRHRDGSSRRDHDDSYSSRRDHDDSYSSRRDRDDSYSSSRRDYDDSYSSRRDRDGSYSKRRDRDENHSDEGYCSTRSGELNNHAIYSSKRDRNSNRNKSSHSSRYGKRNSRPRSEGRITKTNTACKSCDLPPWKTLPRSFKRTERTVKMFETKKTAFNTVKKWVTETTVSWSS